MTKRLSRASRDTICDEVLSGISDAELRRGIGRLFAEAQRLVDDEDVRLVIIAARRLACLYQLLVRAGMPELTGCLLVSNRILETGKRPELQSARTLVLDDSVVVGTTLARLDDELKDFADGETTVLYRAVCLDRDQRADFLLDPLDFKALHEGPSHQVETFSTEIVKELFLNQIPFITDYPTSRHVPLATAEWEAYLQQAGWWFADVTAPLLGDENCYSIAQVPTGDTYERVLSRIVPEAANLVDAFKVRLYVREASESVDVVAVPLAMLAPIRPAALDEAISAICKTIDSEGHLAWRDWKPKAKHRLAQLYITGCVFAEAWPKLTSSGSVPRRDDLERLQVLLYFGDETDSVLDIFEAVVDAYRATPAGTYGLSGSVRLDQPPPSRLLVQPGLQEIIWDTRELIATQGIPTEPSQGELTKLGLVFAHSFSSLLGFVNREYEMPQREKIRKLRSRSEYDEHFRDPDIRILRQGFTMQELTSLIPDDAPGSAWWKKCLVSLGVDAGNDLGIIVPVTQYHEGRDVVYRCYRLGETAQLADRPLVEVAVDETVILDPITRSVDSGYPLQPDTVALKDRRSPGRATSLKELREAVRNFGRVELRYEGEVMGVSERRFDARLTSPTGDDTRIASFSINQLPPEEVEKLGVGSRFTWSMIVRDRRGARGRESLVRIRSEPPLEPEKLQEAARTIGELLGDDRPTSG